MPIVPDGIATSFWAHIYQLCSTQKKNVSTNINKYQIYIYRYLQRPKGNLLKGFSRLQKYLTICRKFNNSGKNCRSGHLPKMPKVTIYLFSAFPTNQMQSGRTRIATNASLLFSEVLERTAPIANACFSFSLSLAEYLSVSNSRRLNRGHLCLS